MPLVVYQEAYYNILYTGISSFINCSMYRTFTQQLIKEQASFQLQPNIWCCYHQKPTQWRPNGTFSITQCQESKLRCQRSIPVVGFLKSVGPQWRPKFWNIGGFLQFSWVWDFRVVETPSNKTNEPTKRARCHSKMEGREFESLRWQTLFEGFII